MKKVFALALALVLAFCMAGCGAEKTTDEPTADMENPMTEIASLEGLNMLVASNIHLPEATEVTNESCYTIKSDNGLIGEYNFTVDGKDCTIRFKNDTTDDISGLYVDGNIAFPTIDDTFVKTDDCTATRWFAIDGQYVLIAKGADVDETWFNSFAEETRQASFFGNGEDDSDVVEDGGSDRENLYLNLQGNWQDSYSQRASATIKSLGNEQGIEIEVTWGDSAAETAVWTMTAKISDVDGSIAYTNCKKVMVSDAGEEVVYENGEGSFEFDFSKLLWNGAAEENCRNCVFEKVN